MVSYSYLATTMVPHRTQFLLLAGLLIPAIVCAAVGVEWRTSAFDWSAHHLAGSHVGEPNFVILSSVHKPRRLCVSQPDEKRLF